MSFRFTTIASNATFTLTKSAASVDEGSQVTITLDTTGVQNGQNIGYTISGNGITTADFVGLSSLTGNVVVQNNTAAVILTVSSDILTDGSETFTLATDNGSTVTVNIVDTSVDAPTYPQTLWRTLANPTPSASDWFGFDVAISGNYTVVGAGLDDTTGPNSGSAYVFNTATGALIRTLANPTPAVNDNFGKPLAIAGIYAVVCSSGQSYVFDVTTGNLVSTLVNPLGGTTGDFGLSVAISGNYVVIGSPAANHVNGTIASGSVHVFDVTTGNLVRSIVNPAPGADDRFGFSVAISGSYIAVGAYGDDTTATDSGTVYVFDASTGNLVSTLANPTPAVSDRFGKAIALSGDWVILGTPYDDTTGSDSGCVYVFDATSGTLIRTIPNPAPSASATFGMSLAASGNLVIVGAPLAVLPGVGGYNGRVHTFDISTGNLVGSLENPAATMDFFGSAVALSGNYAVVGAYQNDTTASDSGRAYIFN